MKNHYRDGGLVISIIALIIITLGLSGFIFVHSPDAFWILAPIIVLVAGFATGKLVQITRKTSQYYGFIYEKIDQVNKLSLCSMPLGAVVTDANKKIIWYNERFLEYFSDDAVYGSSIANITDKSFSELQQTSGVEITYKGRHYLVHGAKPDNDEAQDVYIIYFRDITDYKYIVTERKLSHPVVIIFMIDGYDEMFGANLESETARVTVQVDRLLEDFIAETTGVMRKIGHDKFWAVIEQRHVEALIENKVNILDKAREIMITDRMSVTLSIGIGCTAGNMKESEAFAKQALDMALSRGGDQAAIKTANGFEFYGGVSKGVEKQTKVKARIIANSLMQVIDSSDCVYIMGHSKSDFDCVGASIGLASAIRKMDKEAYVVCNHDNTQSVPLINYVKQHEGDKLSVFCPLNAAMNEITENSLLIIVDIHTKERLDYPELYEKAAKTVVIDHHRKMVNHITDAIIFHNEANASSSSEMVTEMLSYFGEAGKISSYQAEALLAGIMLDTKFFAQKTGVRTFEAAAFLKKLGADTIRVKDFFCNTVESYRLKASLVSGAQIHRRCALAFTESDHEEISVIAAQAADDLLSIIDVDASFTFYKKENAVYVSARSLGEVNVQIIMESLGCGGGHLTMAGARMENVSLEQMHKLLLVAIDQYYDSRNLNS